MGTIQSLLGGVSASSDVQFGKTEGPAPNNRLHFADIEAGGWVADPSGRRDFGGDGDRGRDGRVWKLCEWHRRITVADRCTSLLWSGNSGLASLCRYRIVNKIQLILSELKL